MGATSYPAQMGPYRIDDLLGRGGMGSVFRAFHERLQRPVALKRISDKQRQNSQARKRFVREAQAVARLSHPAIVQIHDIFAFEGDDWIVMELVEGQSLRQQIRSAPLPWSRLLPLAHQITSGLAAAHAAHIVHRDLKTENVLLTDDGRAKILDFGLAKDLNRQHGDDSSLTRNDHVIGTPRAMSPEQVMGREVDHRSDLFSLGTLIYESLTGRSPFRASNVAGTLVKVCSHSPPSLVECDAHVPLALSTLVERLLEKDPNLRPQNASKVLEDLVALMPAGAIIGTGLSEAPLGFETSLSQSPATADTRQQTTLAVGRVPERRQVTLLCCDVQWADLEESYETLPQLRRALRSLAKPLGGHVPEGHGDTPAIVFGYPESHEDDGRRAVQMAEVLLEKIEFPATFLGFDASRIGFGIHTGPAIFQPNDDRDVLHLGSTLAHALTIARLAASSRLAVSQEAWPLAAQRFVSVETVVEPLSDHSELIVHRLSSERDASTNLTSPHLCLGRDNELSLLLTRLELTQEGSFQIAHVYGEAGIGKTFLIDAMRQALPAQTLQWITLEGKEEATLSPFFPLAPLLQQILSLGDSHQGTIEKDRPPYLNNLSRQPLVHLLASRLGDLDLSSQDLLPLLAPVLDLPRDVVALASGPPETVNRQVLDALAQLLIAIARQRPTVCIVEDLHWLDPSTLELLGLLIQEQADVPLFLVMTFRTHFTPPWDAPDILKLSLSHLPNKITRQLIVRLCGNRRLPKTTVDQIVDRSDGVPLFVEQVTQMTLESGAASLLQSNLPDILPGSQHVPTILQQSLTARLDRLQPAKAVAQLASVIGHDFSFELLRNVALMDVTRLESSLQRLISAGILRRRGLGQRARFTFKHALIRDAVYESILTRDRRRIHGQIAVILRDGFAGAPESREENLAWHFTRANQHEEASQRWAAAGLNALKHSHIQEALHLFRTGLETVRGMVPGEARDRRELDLQNHLATHLRLVDGPAAMETEAAYDRVFELSQRLDEIPHLIQTLWGTWAFSMASGKMQRALEVAERMVELVDLSSPPDDYMRVHQALGVACLRTGQLQRAKEYLESSAARAADPSILGAGYEGHIHAYASLGITLWLLGFPDSGRRAALRGIELCETYPSVHFPLILLFAAWVEYFRHDAKRVKELTCRGLELSQNDQASYFHPHLTQLLGLAEAMDSKPATRSDIAQEPWGLARSEASYKELRERSEETVDLSRIAACLCEAHLKRGHGARAQQWLEQGRDILETTHEAYLAAEFDRLEAEVLIHRGDALPQAEDLLHQAISIARQQSARSLELRACLSLAKFLQKQTRGHEAKQRVAEVYEQFDEGFSTGDLKQAAKWVGAPVKYF